MNSKIRYELLWFLPALAGIGFAVRVAILSTDPLTQNIVAFGVGAAVALLAIMMARVAPLDPKQGVKRAALFTAAGSITMLLVVQSCVWPRPWNDDSPGSYFSGKIRIGMTEDIRQWNSAAKVDVRDPHRQAGFDNELAQFIADHYGVEWEPVRINQSERSQVLAGRGDVDLVISNFTINQARAVGGGPTGQPIDFAGPYFIDTTGVWQNLDKHPAKHVACVVGGTTGNSSLDAYKRTHLRLNLQVLSRDNSAQCLQEFEDAASPVEYFATDWTIIKAYLQDKKIRVGDANRTHPNTKKNGQFGNDPGLAAWNTADPPQYYGVALRDNHPITCQDLTAVVNEFLTQTANRTIGFGFAFDNNLAEALGPISKDWHNPGSTVTEWRDKPWVCK